jgi:hypothetical protein
VRSFPIGISTAGGVRMAGRSRMPNGCLTPQAYDFAPAGEAGAVARHLHKFVARTGFDRLPLDALPSQVKPPPPPPPCPPPPDPACPPPPGPGPGRLTPAPGPGVGAVQNACVALFYWVVSVANHQTAQRHARRAAAAAADAPPAAAAIASHHPAWRSSPPAAGRGATLVTGPRLVDY